MNSSWIGFTGMLFLNLCYLPQFIKTLRTKEVKDLSITNYIMLSIGLNFYLIYSIIRRDLVYFISNVSSLTQSLMMLGLIWWYGK